MLKKHIKTIILVFLLQFPTQLFSQEILVKMEAEYKSKSLLDSDFYEVTAKYAQSLLVHNKQEESFKLLVTNYTIAKNLNDLGNYSYLKCIESIQYFVIGEDEKSRLSYIKAENEIEKIKDHKSIAYIYYTGGWLANRKRNEPEAVNYFLKALKHYDLLEDSTNNFRRKSEIHNELARIYGDWNDFEMQEKYTQKSLYFALKQDNADAIFSAYMSVGYMYEKKLIENSEDENLKKLVEKNYLKAIDIYNANEMMFPSDYSFVATNLAGIYIRYFPDSYIEKAKELVNSAKEIAVINDEPNHLSAIQSIMAEIELKNNNKIEAKEIFQQALESLDRSNSKDLNVELFIYEKLIQIEVDLKNFEQAFLYSKKYTEIYKAIYNSEKLEKGKLLEADFERKIKEKENEKLQLLAEKRKQQIKLLELENSKKENDLYNFRLREDIQHRKLKESELISHQKQQKLKLAQLEAESKAKNLTNFQEQLLIKEKLNAYYKLIILSIILILLLVLFLLRQRTLKLRINKNFFKLALEKEKQYTKISALTALLDGQEKERERLARDLHDGLGGLLSAIKLQLSDYLEKNKDKENTELDSVNKHLNFAVNKLRVVSHNLMPDILIKYGLEIALKEFANRMVNNNLEIHVTFLEYTKNLDVDKELFVYRIIQELVNNAIKHANANQIIIQFVEEKNSYHVVVEDDGIGFDMNNLEFKNSAGYINIQSRVQFLKGTFELYSEKNQGTSFEFNFPKI